MEAMDGHKDLGPNPSNKKKIEEKNLHKVVKREVENFRRCEESAKTIHSLLVINRVLFISF